MMVGMNALAKGTTDYYEQPDLDPSVQGHKSMKAAMLGGLQSQMSSEGAGAFMSGFFMKAAFEGPQHLMTNVIFPSIYKGIVKGGNALNPDLFKNAADNIAAHEQAKDAYKKQTKDAANAVVMNPIMASNAMDRNFVKQNEGAQQVDDAMLAGDKHSAENARQDAMYHHIYTLIKAGHEGLLRDHFKALGEMDDKNLVSAFDMPNASAEEMDIIRKGLDSFGDNLSKVRDHYEYVNQNVPNQFSEYPTTGTDEQKARSRLYYNIVEHAKMIATFGRHDYDNTLSRMNDIVNNMEKIKPLTKVPFSDFKLLFDGSQRQFEINALGTELKLT